jgi:hypothetical protein
MMGEKNGIAALITEEMEERTTLSYSGGEL